MKKFGNILFWVVVIGVSLYAAFTLYERYKPPKVVQQPKQNAVSDNKAKVAAPEITLKDLNGKTVSLSDYKGKIVFLNF